MPESIEQEAEMILQILASTPFQECIALSKEFIIQAVNPPYNVKIPARD
ncbi:hypothetical protein [Spirulina sp. 06S082]|nr:hypothetical protein [Spirulina sp. 06S082]MEA5469062.1 hypothetical protein [Spirulina sp. 06S082]